MDEMKWRGKNRISAQFFRWFQVSVGRERERERRIRKEGVIILPPSAPFPNGREYTREMMMIRRRGPKERK